MQQFQSTLWDSPAILPVLYGTYRYTAFLGEFLLCKTAFFSQNSNIYHKLLSFN